MGALDPDFNAENPLQVGLSLGGFAYMAVSLIYVGLMMIIMARPVVRYFFWRVLGIGDNLGWLSILIPLLVAVVLSVTLAAVPIIAGERRLIRLGRSG